MNGNFEFKNLLYKSFLLGIFILAFLFTSLYLIKPEEVIKLAEENGIIENITAYNYLFAGIYGCIFLFFSPLNIMKRKSLLVIPFLSFFFFLEEISFGKQWIHFSAPVLYGKKVDGLHDILEITYNFIQNNLLVSNILSLAIVLLFWYIIKNIKASIKNIIIDAIKEHSAFTFIGTSILLLLIAQAIDIRLLPINGYFEEVIELCASIGFNFAVISFNEKKFNSKEKTFVHKKEYA